MLDKFPVIVFLAVIILSGCDSGGSGRSNIPPGLNLLESECPGEDIVDVPITEGYAWECIIIESGEDYIAGTLSNLSQADCFETRSKSEAYCGIDVLGRASFAASHHKFDLENPPPPDADACDPEFAISIEEVECHTLLL